MTNQEAARTLREMYSGARKGDVALQFLLFGIQYADALDSLNVSQILQMAQLPASYSTEISKGRKLARYVVLKVSDD